MGVSTDAIIAFGVNLGEELPSEWADTEDFDFETLQAAEMGLEHPAEEYGDDTKDVYHRYWDAKREAVPRHPADLITHCSDGFPEYFLAVNGTAKKARRGYPEAFDPSELVVTDEQVTALRAFCERHGIEWREPGWHLFSYWG